MELLEYEEISRSLGLNENDKSLLDELKNDKIIENHWQSGESFWLKAASYCGNFNLSNLEISILPKIIGNLDRNMWLTSGLDILFGMIELSYPENPEYGEAVTSYHASRRGNWAAFLLATLLQRRVSKLVHKGLAKGYLPISENLQAVRGRIDLKANLRANSFDHSKCVCTYDDFVLDVPHNQLVKYGLYESVRLSGLSSQLRGRLENLYWQFEEVTEKPFSLGEIRQIRAARNRLTEQYSDSHETIEHLASRKFFGNELFAVVKGNVFVNMDFLYQTFLTRLVRDRFQLDYRVLRSKDLARSTYLGVDQSGQRIGRLDPDILRYRRGSKAPALIVDAKYKLPVSETGEISVSNPDCYQMFSYLESFNCKEGMLIYPSIEKTDVEQDCIQINYGSKPRIHIAYLDIPVTGRHKQDFENSFQPIAERIQKIISR
jgi:5-methylcytosine-specific restriction enzyme subunit McrC